MNMSCRHRGWVAHHHRVRTESTEERPRQVWLLALGTLLPNCGAISETAGSWTELLEQSNMNSYELKIHVSQDSRNCSKTENIQSRNCNKTENIQKHPKNPKTLYHNFGISPGNPTTSQHQNVADKKLESWVWDMVEKSPESASKTSLPLAMQHFGPMVSWKSLEHPRPLRSKALHQTRCGRRYTWWCEGRLFDPLRVHREAQRCGANWRGEINQRLTFPKYPQTLWHSNFPQRNLGFLTVFKLT